MKRSISVGRMVATLSAVFLAITLYGVPSAQAALDAKAVRAFKSVTALVDLGEHGSGTAFLVHKSGVFATNHHVVDHIGLGGDVQLILNPAGENQTKAMGRVIRIDGEHDLALVKLKDPAIIAKLKLVPPPLGDEKALFETVPIVAFGYPFGKMLATEGTDYPSISVNTGKVSAIRSKEGRIVLVQIDAAVNPGNSGGPVLDDTGKVVGIVVAGIRRTGVNFAIPVSYLKEMIDQPALVMSAANVPFKDRGKSQTFNVELVAITKPIANAEIEVHFTTGASKPRTFKAKKKGDRYEFSAALMDSRNATLPLRVEAQIDNAKFRFNAIDRVIKVGDLSLRLAEVRQLRVSNGKAQVITIHQREDLEKFGRFGLIWRNGMLHGDFDEEAKQYVTHEGKLSGFEGLVIDSMIGPMKLDKIQKIKVASPDTGPVATDYKIEAKVAGKTVCTADGTIQLKDMPLSYANIPVLTLGHLKTKHDVVSGPWEFDSTTMSAVGSAGRIRLPVYPGGSYRMQLAATVLDKNATTTIQWMLPCKDKRVLLELKTGAKATLSLPGLKDDEKKQLTLNAPLGEVSANKLLQMEVMVIMHGQNTVIQVSFEDEQVLNWSGKLKNIQLPDDWKKVSNLGMAANVAGGRVRLNNMNFESMDGRIHWVRPMPSEATTMPDFLMAHWSFDRSKGNQVTDVSRFNHFGLLRDGAKLVPNGRKGFGLALDGNAANMGVTSCAHLNVVSTGGKPFSKRSVSFWFKADDVSSKASCQVIIEIGGTWAGLNLYVHGGQLYAGGWSMKRWPTTFLTTDKIKSGQWHHVALVLDSDGKLKDGALRGYLDGKPFDEDKGISLGNHNTAIGIGRRAGSTRFHDNKVAGNTSFKGVLDDLRIYNHALSITEIKILRAMMDQQED